MIKESVHQFRFGKLRLLAAAACIILGAGCTPDHTAGISTTLAGDLVRQFVAWLLF